MGTENSSALWPVKGSIWGYSHWEYVSYDTMPSKSKVDGYASKENLQRYARLHQKVLEASHEECVEYRALKKQLKKDLDFVTHGGVVDKSTLSAEGSGTADIYTLKCCGQTHIISLLCIATLPFYVIGTVVYNILRIVPVVLYVTGCLIYEAYTGKQIFSDDRKFKVRDITDQIGKSVWNIIRTPYFALGYLFGLLYSLISPLNGRKVTAGFEKQWNHGIDRHRSIWMTMGVQRAFQFEGGGAPSQLGHHAFYIPGCYQPFARVTFENGQAVEVTSASGRSKYEGYIPYKGSCLKPKF